MTAHTDTRTPRLAASEIAAVVGVAGVGVACALSPAGIEHGPILCPFRLVTGLPCPGCGLTRSWVYGVHGDWSQSFAAHPFGLPMIAAIVALAITVVIARVTRRRPPRLERLLWNPVAKVVVAAWLIFSVVRILLVI
ncbi:MAG TPA: DUF2752 domain-containing protein [Gordonia polyisoprenivorans]|uniref:DUF2752 domain-containing protein n=1 Tax=Gordonia polyisoprenivorans TaxID=84595 RepID=A0A846WRQ5_9ACTN|nr:DUF2752 domain-containing protein [Gordonia polyisoprenivorans]NKY03867.1 DUF2752 domain-containing protein [Gordonia polyisoprenivorans]OZC29356.1 DUF2752 domain-containing protein [Gordonia polyisoprenivorans]QUD81488.1 DUF2752 domain-containing protein [Gordonia polyisoprenivorans]UZF57809.1 DUF2752 domain-containing protein [Gordonia polyisoprenivorans]WCB38812.1 DUF2752 domain-containing protein [Gordonia polyisoprenivorans]